MGNTTISTGNKSDGIKLGVDALEKHDIPTAFDRLFVPAHTDREACMLFLRIPNNEHWIRLISEDQVERLKEHAEKGYALSQYTLGRYYQVVEASHDEAREMFIAAAKAGLADAEAALAIMFDLGQLGDIPIDKEKIYQALKDASEKGSVLATFQLYKDLICGSEVLDSNPQGVIDNIKQWLKGDESEDVQKVDPMYYELIALGYQSLEAWHDAANYYMKCIRMGRIETFPDCLILTSFNHDLELIDEEGYYNGIETGCRLGIPYCFTMRASSNKDLFDGTDDEQEQAALHQKIAEDLNTASNGGDSSATMQLGYHYYYGEYGFEENNDLAWGQFLLASGMNSATSWSMLAQMVLDGNAPDNMPGNFVAYCRLMALRLGDNDQLIPVILSYRNGTLKEYKDEIEKYYQPKYNALSDEEKVKYFGMSFIAILDSSGKADLVEFDLNTSTWEELEQIINAKQLKAVHSETLDRIGQEQELDGRITSWIDSDETNPFSILTLMDEEQQPQCFDDIYQLEKIIDALDYEVDRIYYDEFPDDDGHNDPYA